MELMSDLISESTSTHKDMFDQYSQLDKAIEILDRLEQLKLMLDTLSNIEILKELGRIESMVSSIIDMSEIKTIDAENWEVDIALATRLELEGFIDSIMESLKKFADKFKSIKTKVKEISKDTYKWTKDNEETIKTLRSDIREYSDELDPIKDINKVMGDKLGTIRALGSSITDILAFVDSVDKVGSSKSSMTNIDKQVLGVISASKLVDPQDYIKVVRIDRKSLSYIVVSALEDGVVGFRSYVKTSIPKKFIKEWSDKEDLTLTYVRRLIDTASKINEQIISKTDTFNDEIKNIEASLSGNIEDARWKSGPLFRLSNSEVLFYAVGSGTILTGLSLVASSLPSRVKEPVKIVGKGIGTLLIKAGVGIGKVVNTKPGIGITASAAAGTSIYVKDDVMKLKDITFNMLDNKSKMKVLNNRIKLTSHTSVDTIYGLNSLVVDMLSTAKIIMELHKKKTIQ